MPVPDNAATTTSPATAPAAPHDAPPPPPFEAGDRVRFESLESTGAGVVDAAMPDGSVVWVWPDDAMGRKMLHVAEGTRVLLERQHAEPRPRQAYSPRAHLQPPRPQKRRASLQPEPCPDGSWCPYCGGPETD